MLWCCSDGTKAKLRRGNLKQDMPGCRDDIGSGWSLYDKLEVENL